MQKRIWGLTASMLALTCLTVTGCASPTINKPLPNTAIHNTSESKFSSIQVTKLTKNQFRPNIPDGYKVPVSWDTAFGINMNPYDSSQYVIQEGYGGWINKKSFRVIIYIAKEKYYVGLPKPYIIAVSYNHRPVGGLSTLYPIKNVSFAHDSVIFYSNYGLNSSHLQTKIYTINIITGKITVND
ncbi:hypothetical protein J2S04_002924 [Alicyclobacillus tengchongensis]|uniref:Lipoprotein n=1 Tax=Alicyclobacillus tolerans TaxID=90970 RepID=A0ABT9M0B6_9BACL|nr:hypothetical protein [Alicyclobacillus tengchongensis]